MSGPSRVCLAYACGLLLAVAVVGCRPVATPAQAVQARQARAETGEALARLPTGAHLASLTVVDLNTDYGVAVAIEPQVATFAAGDVQFIVINKWLGLRQGSHQEVVQALGPDGQTVLQTEETAFTFAPDSFVVTIAEPFQIAGAKPGVYTLTVRLDGALVARYPFRVVVPPAP